MVALHRAAPVPSCQGSYHLLPSVWYISLVTPCYSEVIYFASDPLLEMPICFHSLVEPDNILMVHLSYDRFYSPFLSSGRFYFPCYFSRQKPTVFSCSHGGAFSPLPLALQLSESQDIFTQLLKCGGLFWCFCNIVEGGISHTPSKSRLSMVESLF